MRRAATILATLLPLALAAAPAAAGCPKTTLGDVEDEVMCLVCGTPLSLATEAPQAQRERELIQRLVARCRSKEQIKRALVAEYGSEVLALPEDRGFDLASYLVPALTLLAAGVAVGLAALRWRRGRRERRATASTAAGAADARLDADIERYDL